MSELAKNNVPLEESVLNKKFDIETAITVLKKQWLIFPILFFLAFAGGYIYLRYTKPVYSSVAVIQRSSQDEGKRILEIEGFDNEGSLSEDIELLKSPFLLEKALRNLNLNISYYSQGEILTEEKYLFSSYHITVLELKDSSLIGIPIQIKNTGEGMGLSFKKGEELIVFSIVENEVIDNEYFKFIFKINDKQRFDQDNSGNTLYFVFNDYPSLTKRLHKDLKVFAFNAEAKTIQISFESNNSRLAMDVVSALIQTFFQYDIDKKSKSSANILSFINSQLDTAFYQLKESEIQIQSFKDSSKVSDPIVFTERILARTSELQAQLLSVDMELELINEIARKVEHTDRLKIYKVIPIVTGSSFENTLGTELTGLHDLLVNKEDISYNVTSDNDIIKLLNKKIESKIESINRTISGVRDQLQFKKMGLQDRIYILEGELYGVPQKEMELSRLNRMFNLNEKYYSLLIEKKTQYSISKAGYTTDNMVLQSPGMGNLISPNGKMVYVGVMVLAFLLGIIFLLIKYLRFNEIQNPDELNRILLNGIGFLGIIPKISSENKNSTLIVHEQPKSALAESCRHIRSNMQFVLDDKKSNVVAITSSISGEGKTFIALNLAGIFALTGKKVLVIDLDLRKPKVHIGFGIENKEGMSAILAKKVNWKDTVNKSEIEGLDFITAGMVPPNPSELILRGELDELIEELKAEYDLILIDNPPIGLVSDGALIMSKADCPIYVFRSNYSKRVFAERLNDLHKANKIKNLFVILNDVDINRKDYGYGYGYGSYYEETTKQKKSFFNFKK